MDLNDRNVALSLETLLFIKRYMQLNITSQGLTYYYTLEQL